MLAIKTKIYDARRRLIVIHNLFVCSFIVNISS